MNNLSPSEVPRIGHDPDHFEAFYREHVGAVGRFVSRRVDDPHVVADLTTDVFLAAIDASVGYRPDRGRPISWLLGIARNVVADHVRSRTREHQAARRLGGRRLLDDDAVAQLVERIDAERELRAIYRSLDGLPERDRKLFELVALDGLSITEAAAVLEVKPATARVRLHRARARVQSLVSATDRIAVTTHPFSQELIS